MTAPLPFEISAEQPEHADQIERLLDQVFGLERRIKTSYRLREGEMPVPLLSLVAVEEGAGLVGAISFWRLCIGDAGMPALLLGPLAVSPQRQGAGIGLALMNAGLAKANSLGHGLVLLVGDLPYYARVGFQRVPEGQITLPGPVDPARLLYLELQPQLLGKANGLVLPPHRHRERVAQKSSDLHGTRSGSQSRAAAPDR
ncbi:MAG: N-acetyltransferase [Pseudomonadota bacterium]|nr:N-acetyltransferase [Pseudomonadota bacterium]